jgi:hypothetical protein
VNLPKLASPRPYTRKRLPSLLFPKDLLLLLIHGLMAEIMRISPLGIRRVYVLQETLGQGMRIRITMGILCR